MRSMRGLPERHGGWLETAFEGTDAIQGTIQRVEYQRRELRVIAQGRLWEFVLAADCRLWFNDAPCILRCFHPLDPVTIIYQLHQTEHMAKAMYGWDRRKTADA